MIPRLFLAGYPVRFLAVTALGSGCLPVCEGPGCDELFSAAELAIMAGVGGPELRVPDDAVHRVEGSAVDGYDWSVAPFDGGAFIGTPASSQVLRVAADDAATGSAWLTDVDPGARLGAALARVGEDLWIGAPGADQGAGALYVVPTGLDDPSLADARLVLTSSTPDDQFGASVFVCADLTGDDRPDVVVSAPLFATPAAGWPYEAVPNLAGAVFLIPSDASGTHRPWEIGSVWWGDSVGAGAGAAVSCDRDLNGDGSVDLAIGSPWAVAGRGQVHLLSTEPLPASGPLGERSWQVLDGASDEWFGRSLVTLATPTGVVLAVGGPGWSPDDEEQTGMGRVQLFVDGSLGEVTPVPVGTLEGVRGLDTPHHFGRWLTAGDLDGDGRDDLVVGAPDLAEVDGNGQRLFDAGRIWVWYGWAVPPSPIVASATSAPFELHGQTAFQSVGRAVVAADYDGDGADELWVPIRDIVPTAGQ